jgi:hypothetical protein
VREPIVISTGQRIVGLLPRPTATQTSCSTYCWSGYSPMGSPRPARAAHRTTLHTTITTGQMSYDPSHFRGHRLISESRAATTTASPTPGDTTRC